MKIHEYQAKKLLRDAGVAVPRGDVATTPAEARQVATSIGAAGPFVVKAQIHAGGRGKGGGIQVVNSHDEVEAAATRILGMTLKTHQTGPEGRLVSRVLVEEGVSVAREMYVGIVVDRARRRAVLMGSREGGMEIEEVARTRPDAICKEFLDPFLGLRPYQARRFAFALGLEGALFAPAVAFLGGLARLYREVDASLAEVNPLVVTADQRLLALDGKINIDDNALARHPDLATMRDLAEEDPLEVEASKFDLNYIKLDGDVGCMVNGAGLAMATMDIIKLAGRAPANFLDVGGGANVARIANAFRILTSDPDVRAVLVNIFGGIVRCDRVAEGIIEALKTVRVDLPLVVRLEGTNAREAGEILARSGLEFHVAKSLADAAEQIVRLSPGAPAAAGGVA